MTRARLALVAALAVGGCLLAAKGVYLDAKASLAQALIGLSWGAREPGLPPRRPWPWADTRVAARLSAPALGETRYVMQDASGESLAFGPGLVLPVNDPGDAALVIAGHRDSHFSFLRRLRTGDRLVVEDLAGRRRQYAVSATAVIDSRPGLSIPRDDGALVLVTCWPFDALLPGGPMRFVVHAHPAEEEGGT